MSKSDGQLVTRRLAKRLVDEANRYEQENATLRAEVTYLRGILHNEPDGTPLRIIGAMFEEAEKRGHPPFSARHGLSYLLSLIDAAPSKRRASAR